MASANAQKAIDHLDAAKPVDAETTVQKELASAIVWALLDVARAIRTK